MILVIEIGGTKLQLGVFDPSRSVLVHCERLKVCRTEGAQGILNQIESALPSVLKGLDVERCGIGFGGPIHEDGSVLKSHQVTGWDCFPLAAWVREKTGLPTYVANDCDAAALAEARYGAGINVTSMFYVTVGTGIGGGLIRHGQRQGTDRPAIAEIGHLRPGLLSNLSTDTVESHASGQGIAEQVHLLALEVGRWLQTGQVTWEQLPAFGQLQIPIPTMDQIQVSDDWYRSLESDKLTTEHVAAAAYEGIWLAKTPLQLATTTLGWAIAQMATLVAPQRIVIGGGVSKMGDTLFWQPLRNSFAKYVFGPLRDPSLLVPSLLGDDVVLYGAAAIAMPPQA